MYQTGGEKLAKYDAASAQDYNPANKTERSAKCSTQRKGEQPFFQTRTGAFRVSDDSYGAYRGPHLLKRPGDCEKS